MYEEKIKLFPRESQYFKEEVVEQLITIYKNKPNIEHILNFLISPEIMTIKAIKTINAVSEEGLRLTGTKLLVHVKLKEKLTYVAENKNGSVHGLYYEYYKTLPVILPNELDGKNVFDLIKCNRIKVTPYISADHTRIFNKREVFNCCLLFLDVKFCA